MVGEKPNKLAYLVEELNDRCAVFHRSVDWYRRRYYAATMSAVVLSALITLIAGWKPAFALGAVDGSNIILILGAISTVVSAWGAFFSPKESWAVYATTLHRLRALQAKIAFLAREPNALTAQSESITELFQEYQAILDAHNKAWSELRAKSHQVHDANMCEGGERELSDETLCVAPGQTFDQCPPCRWIM